MDDDFTSLDNSTSITFSSTASTGEGQPLLWGHVLSAILTKGPTLKLNRDRFDELLVIMPDGCWSNLKFLKDKDDEKKVIGVETVGCRFMIVEEKKD